MGLIPKLKEALIEQSCLPATISCYVFWNRKFFGHCQKPASQWTGEDVRRFMFWLHDQNYSPVSRKQALNAIAFTFKHVLRADMGKLNLPPMPRVHQTLRMVPSREAIFWGRVDAKVLQPSGNPAAVFRRRGHWASKNQRGNTSRDRFTQDSLIRQIGEREAALMELGCGLSYFQAIQNKQRTAAGGLDLVKYVSALDRTLRFKRAAAAKPSLPANV